MSRFLRRRAPSLLAWLLLLTLLFSCGADVSTPDSDTLTATQTLVGDPAEAPSDSVDGPASLRITNCDRAVMALGEQMQLLTDAPEEYAPLLEWSASNDAVFLAQNGTVIAMRTGKVTVTVTCGNASARALIEVIETRDTEPPATYPIYPDDEPDTGTGSDDHPIRTESFPEKEGSPDGYRPARSPDEALERSENGLLSGYLFVPDQEPTVDPNRPTSGGKYIRNNEAYFADNDTYVVLDANGHEVFRVYRGGGYVTLEEVAAYLYAFGDVPANYISGKKMDPENSIWGEYLRLNHSKFSGNTTKYPYEPVLPRIDGCGGDLQYYEIDIGTTGTDSGSGYAVRPYNNGSTITRGAARIVYSRFDANGNKVIEPEEKYIFYTYNHYNDFQEYLNYYNGWGEMFGNITGGGSLSSKTDYNPTDYVAVVLAPLPSRGRARAVILCCDFRRRYDELVA